MTATPTTDPARQRQLHLGLAAIVLGVVLVLTCQQVIAGHVLPHGWRHVIFLTGIVMAGVCLCVGTWCLIRSQR